MIIRQRARLGISNPRPGRGWYLTDFISRPEPSRGPSADLGRKIVAQIPTRLGRMVFLFAMRDPETGRYAHPALVENFGRDVADRTLSHAHHQVFMEWLRLNLADQKEDLEAYLRTAGIPASALPYRNLAPLSAHEVERQLYLTDLEVILQMISFEPETAAAPTASRRR
jgi:hypothetical protein